MSHRDSLIKTNKELFKPMDLMNVGFVGAAGSGGGSLDISNASYDSVSLDVSSQSGPRDCTFKTDGTKMYMISHNTVYQYTLSTGWDLSTASYDSVSFSVSEENSTTALYFKDDGTKMYIIGVQNDSVFQYTLSTAWDISTASYDSVSFSVASQETTPYGLTFKDDGTKMYIIGNSNDTVFQYTLSTGWDLSTASYDSVSFSVASQEATALGVIFNSDGTKMLIIGIANDTVYQYSLSTAWDLSTASYDSLSFSVTSQDSAPYDLRLSSDDTKMYVTGQTNSTIYQYSTGL